MRAEANEGKTLMHIAVSNDAVEFTKLLIAGGADIHAEASLHVAAFHNAVEVAKLLIDNGADMQAQDNDGDTPLNLAKANGYQEIIALFEAEAEAEAATPARQSRTRGGTGFCRRCSPTRTWVRAVYFSQSQSGVMHPRSMLMIPA